MLQGNQAVPKESHTTMFEGTLPSLVVPCPHFKASDSTCQTCWCRSHHSILAKSSDYSGIDIPLSRKVLNRSNKNKPPCYDLSPWKEE